MSELREEVIRDRIATGRNALELGRKVSRMPGLAYETPAGQPVVAALGMVVSVALGIYPIRKMMRKKK